MKVAREAQRAGCKHLQGFFAPSGVDTLDVLQQYVRLSRVLPVPFGLPLCQVSLAQYRCKLAPCPVFQMVSGMGHPPCWGDLLAEDYFLSFYQNRCVSGCEKHPVSVTVVH